MAKLKSRNITKATQSTAPNVVSPPVKQNKPLAKKTTNRNIPYAKLRERSRYAAGPSDTETAFPNAAEEDCDQTDGGPSSESSALRQLRYPEAAAMPRERD